MEKNIKLIADITILLNDKVLMVRYKDTNKYDHQKGWFLPDDGVQHGEHPEAAAKRILEEQLNIKSPVLTLHYIESFTGNDRSWHLVFHYVMNCKSQNEYEKSDEISEMNWFSLEKLPDDKEIAHHGWARHTIEEITSVK